MGWSKWFSHGTTASQPTDPCSLKLAVKSISLKADWYAGWTFDQHQAGISQDQLWPPQLGQLTDGWLSWEPWAGRRRRFDAANVPRIGWKCLVLQKSSWVVAIAQALGKKLVGRVVTAYIYILATTTWQLWQRIPNWAQEHLHVDRKELNQLVFSDKTLGGHACLNYLATLTKILFHQVL